MIAFFGGSFDPVHEGHCHLAEELQKRFKFQTFYFVPAKKNPLKPNETHATSKQRLEMLALAIAELKNPVFKILDWEIHRDGPSYTVDTLRKLKEQSSGEISLIIGNELLATFPQWKEPEEILKLAQLIIVRRDPNSPVPEKFQTVDVQALPYSSTELRSKIQKQWENGDLAVAPQGIQRSVWLFVKENRLYCR